MTTPMWLDYPGTHPDGLLFRSSMTDPLPISSEDRRILTLRRQAANRGHKNLVRFCNCALTSRNRMKRYVCLELAAWIGITLLLGCHAPTPQDDIDPRYGTHSVVDVVVTITPYGQSPPHIYLGTTLGFRNTPTAGQSWEALFPGPFTWWTDRHTILYFDAFDDVDGEPGHSRHLTGCRVQFTRGMAMGEPFRCEDGDHNTIVGQVVRVE